MAAARRALPPLAVAAAVLVLAAPFLSLPWHIDEPMFLAAARHILVDPLHPYAFDFNWYGRASPMGGIASNPPLFCYVLALAWKASGGREWLLRLMLLPLDLSAAWALLALASRFLRRPLWPTLVVLAAPAYALDMSHAMAEKLLAALAFPALYLCVTGVDEGEEKRFWASAALFAAALLTKLAGLFLLIPAVLYARRRGVPLAKLAAFVCLGAAPLVLYMAAASAGPLRGGAGAIVHLYSDMMRASSFAPAGRLRALLAFVGALAVAPALWSLAWLRPRRGVLAAGALSLAVLFLPAQASWMARGAGLALSALALAALAAAWSSEPFLRDWAFAGLALVVAYGFVSARTILFMIPPLTFAAARELERRWPELRLRLAYAGSAAGLAALTLALGSVDYRYALAQKTVAQFVAHSYAGRRIWCASHWGLQEYLTQRGARELDWTRGGWDQARPGDVVVASRVNADVLLPEKPVVAEIEKVSVTSPIPLRLISAPGGQASFYCNLHGFLPFTIGREPLDEFEIALLASATPGPK